MRKIKVNLSIGYPSATQEDVLEIEDDATENEIDETVQEWASNYINTWWEEVDAK